MPPKLASFPTPARASSNVWLAVAVATTAALRRDVLYLACSPLSLPAIRYGEYSSLVLNGRSMGERLTFSTKQTEAAQRDAQDWKKRYEKTMNDYNRASENAAAQYVNVQKEITSLEEKLAALISQLDGAKREALEWHSKYEQYLSAQRTETERLNTEVSSLQNRSSTAEARLAAVREQSEAAKAEPAEWQRSTSMLLLIPRLLLKRQLLKRSAH